MDISEKNRVFVFMVHVTCLAGFKKLSIRVTKYYEFVWRQQKRRLVLLSPLSSYARLSLTWNVLTSQTDSGI